MKSIANRRRGQSSMEFVVVCAAIALTLGIGMSDDTSVLRQLLEGFRTGYQRLSYSLSLPL
ncbi:MAG TPA: hypothetical protein VL593_02565 [Ramlibacter sp.]|jgi:hypothetical protein|nr:hypothetical protein [Ramlibacter sp.]